MNDLCINALSTPIGWISYGVSRRGLLRVHIGFDEKYTALKRLVTSLCVFGTAPAEPSREDVRFWNGVFTRFFLDRSFDHEAVPIDDSNWTAFQRSVYETLRKEVPWGSTITYGELSLRAVGYPAARAVGNAMARNPVPLIVPCHRVVPATGGLGGFSGEGGRTLKKRLLALEKSRQNP